MPHCGLDVKLTKKLPMVKMWTKGKFKKNKSIGVLRWD